MVDRRTLDEIRNMSLEDWRDICTVIAEEGVLRKGLTERETEITMMVLTGWQNADIARRLGIAGKTLKAHMHTIYRAFDARSRGEFLGGVFPMHSVEVPAEAPRRKWGKGWRGEPGRI